MSNNKQNNVTFKESNAHQGHYVYINEKYTGIVINLFAYETITEYKVKVDKKIKEKMSNNKQSMKTQIDKLIELAKDYHTFGIEVNLPMTHNHIRGGHQAKPEWAKDGKLINVYLANEGMTWLVEFDKVIVTQYMKNIAIPFDSTEESLQKTHDDAYDYLHNYLLVDVAKIKLGVMKEKHKEIKRLEKELKKLKGLV